MEIRIKIDLEIADIELIAALADRITDGDGDPKALAHDIKMRLRRLVKVAPLDSGA
jgi:hypothetical protein